MPVEIVTEILLRLPPREPACLRRFSLACKAWCAAVSDPGFRRRLHDLHQAPPVLGFLHNWEDEGVPRFIHTTDSPFSLAAPDCRSWRALDCRHGRALFLSKGQDAGKELLLWEPLTGAQQRVRVPAAFERDYGGAEKMSPTAAVFCAADKCDHRDCPFRLVFLFSVGVHTSAFMYSSETGEWGEPTSTQGERSMEFTHYSSVLVVKKSLLYFMSDDVLILEYDLARHNLTVLHPPDRLGYPGRLNILLTEGGGLGFCQYLYPKLKMWTRDVSDDTDAEWVPSRALFLENLLPIGNLLDADSRVQVMGFAEEANVIFFNTANGIFTVELKSRQVRKVWDNCGFCNLIPVVSFYTPVPRGEHQDPLLSGPSEEPGGEEDKTDQAQQLFDKESNAIKEGSLVNAFECVTHDLEIRDPCYGEVTPECDSMEDKHGHALPSEAQEVTDRLGDVPNSALNEDLVKSTSTTSEDDAGNSKTPGNNVEDAAPTSEKYDS